MPEPEGPGGPLAPPIFCRSVNPIWTGEGRLSPPITNGTPKVFHLPASLMWLHLESITEFSEKLSAVFFKILRLRLDTKRLTEVIFFLLMSEHFGTFNSTFDSSHSPNSAYQNSQPKHSVKVCNKSRVLLGHQILKHQLSSQIFIRWISVMKT